MSKGVNLRYEKFAQGIMAHGNASRAAREAGYSEKTAGQIGSRLLKNVKIQARIAELLEIQRQELAARAGAGVDRKARVLKELERIGFSDMRQFASWGPGGVMLHDDTVLTEDESPAVAEVSEKQGQFGSSITFKLHDKLGALKALGQHEGLFVEKHEHTGKDGAPLPPPQVMYINGIRMEF